MLEVRNRKVNDVGSEVRRSCPGLTLRRNQTEPPKSHRKVADLAHEKSELNCGTSASICRWNLTPVGPDLDSDGSC